MANKKVDQLEGFVNKPTHDHITTAEGLKIDDNQDSLKVGGPHLGSLVSSTGDAYQVLQTFTTCGSPLYDAVVVVGSGDAAALAAYPDAAPHLIDAFRHKKPIGFAGGAEAMLTRLYPGKDAAEQGLIAAGDGAKFAARFIEAMKQVRFWTRPEPQLL